MQVGSGVSIGARCRIVAEPGAEIVLGDGCELDDGCTLAAYAGSRLVIEARSFLGHHCTVAARDSVRIGAGTFLGEMVSIRDHDHGRPPSSGAATIAPVTVGRDVWLGAKVTVLRGTDVGDEAVVGANAVVRGTVPPRAVAVGVPARVLPAAG
jgi:acetyltransferase-like isoleucine patch superfamily enzyme